MIPNRAATNLEKKAKTARQNLCERCGLPITRVGICSECIEDIKGRRQDFSRTLAKAGVPTTYRKVPHDLLLSKDVLEWRGDPWAVTFLGPVGSGKTWAATRLYGEVACLDDRFDGAWEDVTALVEDIRLGIATDHDGDRLRHACQIGVLLLDDLLAERTDSEFVRDKVSLILRTRYNFMRRTIVTANLSSLTELSRVEPRLASRLAEGKVIKLTGKDRRVG